MGLFTCLKLSTCLRPDGTSLPIWGPGCCSGLHNSWTLWRVHRSANWWCSALLSRTLPWSKYPCFAVSSCLQSPQTGYSVTHPFQCSTWSTPWIHFPTTCCDPSSRDHSLLANPYHKTVPMIRMQILIINLCPWVNPAFCWHILLGFNEKQHMQAHWNRNSPSAFCL